jgi:MFS family permease
MVWGHFGDRVGRRTMLLASLLTMGVATVGVGLLPTYAQIGGWAPVLLVLLRLMQGLSVGGEWAGAALLVAEHAPPRRRGRWGAWCQIGTPAGVILAQLAFFAPISLLSRGEFDAWGWRLPFLFGGVLVVVGLFVRLGVDETPVFRALRAAGARSRTPLVSVFRSQRREVLLAAASFVANVAISNIFLVYLTSYGSSVLGLSRTLLLGAVLAGAAVMLLAVVLFAVWSDRVGRRPIYLAGSVLLAVWSFPFFLLVDTRTPALLFLAVVVLCLGLGATYGPQVAMFTELFAPRHRYSGASVAYGLGAVLGGGFAPLISTALQQSTGTSLSVSLYMLIVSAISLVAVILLPETAEVPGRSWFNCRLSAVPPPRRPACPHRPRRRPPRT